MATDPDTRARRKSGLPPKPNPGVSWPERLIKTPFTWVSVGLVVTYIVLLVLLYNQVVHDREVAGGVLPGMGAEAWDKGAAWGLISLIPFALAFILSDRWRPQRLWIWLLALGWGACVATFLSMQINTWAAGNLSIEGSGDPATASRAAIFVAPFVEEATKGSVLFLLAILLRYRWVSRLSAVSLAGLSAIGFAYVENILYYGRAYRYAAETYGVASPDEALRQIFFLRGVMTPFAHPLFTIMIGIGLGLALRTKSKTVRILAPLVGFLAAAFLHMSFNATATLVQGPVLLMMWVTALLLVVRLAVMVVREVNKQGRLVHYRLTEYVQMGWLEPGDPDSVSGLRKRIRALWYAIWHPVRNLPPTIAWHSTLSELAYLRDAMVRGLVDQAGWQRERELLEQARALRGSGAIITPEGKPDYPWRVLRRRGGLKQWSTPQQWAPPTGAPASTPQVTAGTPGSAPLGHSSKQYSAVDPTWGPPQ
ncbi:PrsW family intramembrane metalloprotease [Enemella sp. A6]|uniref:PrsW family intramembrane metalloprotease n=1 Tax=Enemella sp. A6 TaxID=3440152 RepID=UPI003EB90656